MFLLSGLVVAFALIEATGVGRRFFVASSRGVTLRRGEASVFRLSIFRHSNFEYQELQEDGQDPREDQGQDTEGRGGYDGPQGQLEVIEGGPEEVPQPQGEVNC